MSVDTKAIIRKDVSLEQIVGCLSTEYIHVEVIQTNMEDFFRIVFSRDNENATKCTAWLSFDFDTTLSDFGVDGVYVSANYRHHEGEGTKAVKLLCEIFGGYFDECDCDDEGFMPVNLHLLEQGGEVSALEKFKRKAITKFGFSKLPDILGLLDEYVAMKSAEKKSNLEHFRKKWQEMAQGVSPIIETLSNEQ